MTLLLLSLNIAITTVLDILTDIIAIAIGRVNPVELGLLNAFSYAVFVLSVFTGSRLADRGIIKIQVLFSLITLFLYVIILHTYVNTLSIFLLVTLYSLYPVAQAFSRTSIYAYIHEEYPNNTWSIVHAKRIALTAISECILLFAISRAELMSLNVYILTMVFLLVNIITFLAVKDPVLRIEKAMYRIDMGLKKLEMVVFNNIIAYSVLDLKTRLDKQVFKSLFSRRKPSVSTILLALSIYRLSNAILLIQFPVFLSRSLNCSMNCVLSIYAVARLSLILEVFVSSIYTKITSMLLLTRALIPIAMIIPRGEVNYVSTSLIFLSLVYLNNKIDITLYSLYLESLGRVETTRYMFIGELMGFIGILVSGVLYLVIGYEGIVFFTSMVLTMTSFTLRT